MEECQSCRKPKAPFECKLCLCALCKSCVQRLANDAFSFLEVIPPELSHQTYCGPCYDEKVAPALQNYEEVMTNAKQAFVFFKTQRKEVPLIKKSKETRHVPNCDDRDETILRLAFFAAEEGYNAVIDVEAKAEKIRNGSYQTSKWSGSGVPAQVDGAKIEAQDLQNEMYR